MFYKISFGFYGRYGSSSRLRYDLWAPKIKDQNDARRRIGNRNAEDSEDNCTAVEMFCPNWNQMIMFKILVTLYYCKIMFFWHNFLINLFV